MLTPHLPVRTYPFRLKNNLEWSLPAIQSETHISGTWRRKGEETLMGPELISLAAETVRHPMGDPPRIQLAWVEATHNFNSSPI